MNKKWALALLLCFCLVLAGCGPPNWPDSEEDKSREEEKEWRGPSISDNITWYSYGNFVLNNSGRDATARTIIKKNGWHVYNDHNGGYGDTLQIASPNEEIVFVWAWNTFVRFSLVKGWTGQTEKGAYIGIERGDFHQLHPEFEIYSGNESVFYKDENTNNYPDVIAYFEDDLLVELRVR